MNDAELIARLRRAFEPYVGGFCQKPCALRITLVLDRIDGDVALKSADFAAVTGKVQVQLAIEEAFNALCRANDATRGPSLRFIDAGP